MNLPDQSPLVYLVVIIQNIYYNPRQNAPDY